MNNPTAIISRLIREHAAEVKRLQEQLVVHLEIIKEIAGERDTFRADRDRLKAKLAAAEEKLGHRVVK